MRAVQGKGEGFIVRQFWRVRGVFTTRKVALMGLFVAMTAVLAPVLNIYLTPQHRLFSFVYLPGAVAAMLFGPVAGLAVGFAGDFMTFLFTPGITVYFPGFALSAMLTNLVYAAFLYRPPPNPARPNRELIFRILLAQAVVLVSVNLGLNMLWLNIMYGQTAGEMFAGYRVALKLAQFPVDVGLLFGLKVILRRVPPSLLED